MSSDVLFNFSATAVSHHALRGCVLKIISKVTYFGLLLDSASSLINSRYIILDRVHRFQTFIHRAIPSVLLTFRKVHKRISLFYYFCDVGFSPLFLSRRKQIRTVFSVSVRHWVITCVFVEIHLRIILNDFRAVVIYILQPNIINLWLLSGIGIR